jgi:hypothetical protein
MRSLMMSRSARPSSRAGRLTGVTRKRLHAATSLSAAVLAVFAVMIAVRAFGRALA